jgi:NAD(P)-dependent dehydrogenase (short-subunit alcohol dehydrogenase family)
MESVALVTGGSSGIGLATAGKLAEEGMRVFAAARTLSSMESLKPLGVRPINLDLTADASIQACVEEVLRRESRLDVVVNAAGFGLFGSVEETALEAAREQFEVNVFGLARLTQLCLPQMREQGSGRIVNVSSLAGFFASPLGGWYSASKFALEALSDSLRLEVGQFGIDVVLVEPGPVRTDWHNVADKQLRATSGSGVYAELAAGVSAVITGFEEERITSDPEDVAAVIASAAVAARPKARYLVGKGARTAVALRRLLPTRSWDTAVLQRHSRVRPNTGFS